jgi:Zn-dependent peptidase ImmA (M78 family)
MSSPVSVKPELIHWAIERSGLKMSALEKFPINQWMSGKKRPTLRQLELFAKRTMTPLGYLFLSTPPEEKLPIPDFRTIGNTPIDRPSPNLIETIQTMQRRQAWMRDFLIEEGHAKLPFIGSLNPNTKIETAAENIRKTLGLSEDWASQHSTRGGALHDLCKATEDIEILVAMSSVVGLYNRRHLNPQEFRGFVLFDDYAPFIFVNSADAASAQMFTMAHELVHLWLGYGGLFNLINMQPHNDEKEKYCNRVAAEFLIPGKKLAARWSEARDTENPYKTLADWFKVSSLVVARRALDMNLISKSAFFVFYKKYQETWKRLQVEKKSGGNFYWTHNVHLGRRFAYAVVCATKEGRLLYRDAYKLTGLSGDTFDKFAKLITQRMKNG